MEIELLELAGKTAGIGGIAIGALILVFRSVIARNIFPNLTKQQAYSLLRLVVVLVWSIAVLGIGAWTYISANTRPDNARASSPQLSASDSVAGDSRQVAAWIIAAEEARQKKTIHHDRPLPTSLLSARSAFEKWWVESSLRQKLVLDHDVVYKALKYVARLYRIQELQSESKPSSNHWVDESIRYFEEVEEPYYLVESLLDKAAIYLELSQIEHTEPDMFRRIAENGDSVMARAVSLANDEQKPTAYRIWARFMYNLGRPRSGNLTENWNNNYLLLSYEKMKQAFDLQPTDMKNATQLARSAHRAAMNPPQDTDPKWTAIIREVQRKLAQSWNENKDKLTTPTRRIPPLNVLANITMEAVRREWENSPNRVKFGDSAMEELTEVAVPALREALALVRHTEWEENYDFDLNYDMGRINAVITRILIEVNANRAEQQFQEVLTNMRAARLGGSAIQNDAAFQSVDSDPNLAGLPEEKRQRLKELFRSGS